jgi:YidC/Oxa1 family membrane protein insertase
MFIFANVIESAFGPLIRLFEAIIVFVHEHLVFGSSWGLAIVYLTVIVRAVLVPLTYRQLKSMQEMQRLAPEMSKIKERYKDDKQRQQQELMKFYQENKINPLASCLPLLLQLPVFVALFYMLREDLKKHICPGGMVEAYNHQAAKLAHHAHQISEVPSSFISSTTCGQTPEPHSAKFLFIPDITSKATGIALIVLIVLYVGSQLGSTLIATASADPNQRRLMLLLPVIFVVILYRYPAGLLVYWITTNMWTIGQQSIIRRRLPPPPRPDPATANGKPKRGFREMLAEAAARPTANVASAPAAKAGGATSAGTASTGSSSAGSSGSGAAPSAPPPRPPRPPRKKKKRSGRRR